MGERIEYLHIDSRDRNVAAHPSALKYRMSLEETCLGNLRNITEIELIGWCFPKIANEEYAVLEISELEPRMQSTNNLSTGKFAILYFDNYNIPKGEIKPMKGGDFDKKIIQYDPPLPSLSHISISFTKHGGDIEEADITPSGGLGPEHEVGRNNLLFKITSRDHPHRLPIPP